MLQGNRTTNRQVLRRVVHVSHFCSSDYLMRKVAQDLKLVYYTQACFYAYPCSTCVIFLWQIRICMFTFLHVRIISWAFIVVHSIKVRETAVRERRILGGRAIGSLLLTIRADRLDRPLPKVVRSLHIVQARA